jgi:hypothetical protein
MDDSSTFSAKSKAVRSYAGGVILSAIDLGLQAKLRWETRLDFWLLT